MAKLSEIFKSDYLKADEIPDEGMVVTITDVEVKELGQGKDKEVKPVLSFAEVEKQLVCNKTNCNTLVKLTGSDDTDNWTGVKIKLVSMEVQFKDELVNAIRISSKPVKAAPKKAPAPIEPSDNDGHDGGDDDLPI
jgi:hypothetical protein